MKATTERKNPLSEKLISPPSPRLPASVVYMMNMRRYDDDVAKLGGKNVKFQTISICLGNREQKYPYLPFSVISLKLGN